MPKLKNVEKKIWDLEEFEVKFLQNGKDVHGDREGIPQYPYTNAAKNGMTVNEWKTKRFAQSYPGFDVKVLDVDGNTATGQKKLGTLRDTYLDED